MGSGATKYNGSCNFCEMLFTKSASIGLTYQIAIGEMDNQPRNFGAWNEEEHFTVGIAADCGISHRLQQPDERSGDPLRPAFTAGSACLAEDNEYSWSSRLYNRLF